MTTFPTQAPTSADVVMADGRIAIIRLLRADDRVAMQALHDEVSDDAFRLRFFTTGRASGTAYVDHLFAAADVVCLVAVLHERIVAAATAEPIGTDAAEVAFLVADSEHGLGLGSLLVEHLTARCRDIGIERLVAEVLWENHLMLEVFRNAGFGCTRTDEGTMVRLDMVTEMSPDALTSADAREASAEARSLAGVLYPRVVAVVGVRSDRSGIGNAVLDSIRHGGFTGTLVGVHPAMTSIDGVPAYARLTDVPAQVDLAIVAVPAERVLDAIRDAISARVRGAVVISSGFSELGEAGKEIQRTLVKLARGNGIRLIGPNCLGILVNDPSIRLNATFTQAQPPSGGLALASQSGGVGIALLDSATELGLGVHTFISLGNKADVSGNDLLSAWLDDPKVTAAALYLESFGNAPKFARIARRFSRTKPLLAVVGGRSAGGRRAGQSHTAAAATPAVGVAALLAQAGVIACRGADDMSATALLLAREPLPAGKRVGIISNAGGIGVLAADEADGVDLRVPGFSAALQATIGAHVSGTIGLGNPVDIGAGGSPADLAACVQAVLASGEVDALLVVLVATALSEPDKLLDALATAKAQQPDIPLLVVTMSGMGSRVGGPSGVTRFASYGLALEALSRAAARKEWLAEPSGPAEPRDLKRARTARQHALAVLAGVASPSWLTPAQTAQLLEPYGLDQNGVVVNDAWHATRVAEHAGYPVVVKVADPAVQHKTDRGLVKVGLRSAVDVWAAFDSFAHELGNTDTAVLVQPTATGVELALGLVNDPAFGPMIRIAAGGIGTNLWNDEAFLLPPVTARDAKAALESLRLWPMLNGYRGSAPGAVDALVTHIVSLAQLAVDVPEVSELDLNPVIVNADAAVVVDAKVRLGRNPIQRAGVPRQLSTPI